MAEQAAPQSDDVPATPGRPAAIVLVSCVLQTLFFGSLLSEPAFCLFLSEDFWEWQVDLLGGTVQTDPQTGQKFAELSSGILFAILVAGSAVLLGVAGIVAAKLTGRSVKEVVIRWAAPGWLWLSIPGIYELIRVVLQLFGQFNAAALLGVFAFHIMAIAMAGCLAMVIPATRCAVRQQSPTIAGSSCDSWKVSRTTLIGVAVFSVVFVTMNWQIHAALLLPHGDSAMYGEHLWNVIHGKGFRSYLDQGLFLGEHVQVVHLLLLPLYGIWPSQLLLELCETVALAAGAFPVFWMARRHSGSTACGSLLAIGYLLYTPLQYLDIEVDLKTFRPMSFGVTAMLFGLDTLERGRLKSTAVYFLLALAAKEDFALILGPLGVWLTIHAWRQRNSHDPFLVARTLTRKRGLAAGIGLTVFAAVYLLLVTRVIIPWFRGGEEVHYARYFAKFGDSLGEILISMLTNPPLLLQEFLTLPSASYLLALFVPLAFLPFLSPGRLLVAAPILGLLCLNEIVKSDPLPRHHFQGPVIPILFWAVAGGLGNSLRWPVESWRQRWLQRVLPGGAVTLAAFSCVACLQSGTMLGMSPASLSFWDSGSPNHWSRYIPGERAEHIGLVLAAIPENSRVASTDFVHSRLIHYERSYDYSGYRRKVAGDKEGVPDDTDYIVIDTKHRYSEVHSPADVRELQTEPHRWELLEEIYEKSNGCFIVLKRRTATPAE